MSVAPATKGVLLVACLAACSGLAIAMGLSRVSPGAGAVGADAVGADAVGADAVRADAVGARATRTSAAPADALARRESAVLKSYLEKPAGHFRILYEGGTQQSIGDRVARVLEAEYLRIGKTLNSYPADTITVILYTNQEFRDLTRSPSWSSADFDGRIRVAVEGALQSPRELDRLVTHELVHAVVAATARSPRRVPAWLNEGLATHLEAAGHPWTSVVLRKAETIVPLESLVNGFGGLDEAAALVAYAESATAAEILCAQLGPNIGSFLRLIGNGESLDRALLEFQVQPNAFHAEWRRRVGYR